MKVSSVDRALLRRELVRLWSIPSYLLNGCMGSLMIVIGTVYLIIKGETVSLLVDSMPELRMLGVALGCLLLLFLVGLNYLTCSSVSLDGKTLWLAQSLPVTPWQILRAKLRMSYLITMPPTVLACVVLTCVIRPGVVGTVLLFGISLVYCVFHGMAGLVLNVKMPRLDWESEAYAIKNSGSVMAAGLGEMGLLLGLGLLVFALRDVASLEVLLVGCLMLLAAATWLLYRWLRTQGAERLSALS